MKKKYSRKKTANRVRKPGVRYTKTSLLGKVTHYFNKINVAIVRVHSSFRVGDYVEFLNGDEAFNQVVESMQVDHGQITYARKASEIGLKTVKKVKEGWILLRGKRPSLLNNIPKAEEQKKPEQFKPIFPQVQRTVIRTTLPASPSPMPNPKPNPVSPPSQPKKSGYDGVNFLKF